MDEQQHRRSLICLTGFMGSGKSTIGPILANTLGFRFVDMDTLIEKHAGKSISAVFDEMGEGGFRALEREVLAAVAQMKQTVVSLGGGTVASEDNFQLIQSCSILVYLQMSPDEAARRMKNKTNRPLLRGREGQILDESALKDHIEGLMAARERFYGKSDVIILTERKKIGATVDEIVHRLRPYLPS